MEQRTVVCTDIGASSLIAHRASHAPILAYPGLPSHLYTLSEPAG